MMGLVSVLLGFLLLLGNGSQALAASEKSTTLRQANGLVAFIPSEKFLSGNFVADEMNPAFIFGTVKAFAASRKCPTTWLIEEKEKIRLAGQGSPDTPAEYTIYLEEDCPDKVTHYVFIDQCGLTPMQWIEWRRQFHKSKTDPQFALAKAKLEQALKEGFGADAELRFLLKDGELMAKSPEEFLQVDLKFAPIYDLNRQKKISK